MGDLYASQPLALNNPLIGGLGVLTPDDNVDLPVVTQELYISGVGGNIAVVWLDGSTTVEPVQQYQVLRWRIRRLLATGTTATLVRGYY